MPDSLPVPPGGERQDPREWTLRICDDCGHIRAPMRCFHSCGVEEVRVVEASSVPVGGAPRDDSGEAMTEGGWMEVEYALRSQYDEGKTAYYMRRLRAFSVPVGAPRDDQNDDEYALAEARGFTDVDRVVVATLVARLPHVMTVDADDCAGAILAALETRDDRSESSPAVPSSGAAPKGEQEEQDG